MLAAVELDDQRGLAAGEIGKILADWQLPDELGSIQLAIADQLPEHMLGVRLVAAQQASAWD